MDNNRPGSREQNVKEGQSGGIKRRGDGVNGGPAGNRTEQFIKEKYEKAAKEKADGEPKRPSGGPSGRQDQAPDGKGLIDDLGNMLGGNSGGSNNSPLGGLGDLLGSGNSGTSNSPLGDLGDLLEGGGESAGNASGSGNIFGGMPSGGNTGNAAGGGNASGGGSGAGGTGGGFSFGSGGGSKKGCLSIIIIVIVIVVVLFLFRSCLCGGSSGLTGTGTTNSGSSNNGASNSGSSLLDQLTGDSYDPGSLVSGYDYDDYYNNYNSSTYSSGSYGYSDYSGSSYSNSGYDMSDILGGLIGGSSGSGGYGSYLGNTTSSSWDSNTGTLNTNVVSGTPAKRTEIKGGGQDVVTLMIYVCGSDLESRNGAATMDIQEMLKAKVASENVNIIVYTGGSTQWQNNVVNSNNNQIYQIKGGQLYRLENNMGNKPMTDPNTLSEFIKYCNSNFPANRNMLILWDHGGGSVSGYAYDEKYKQNGYMSLAGINRALRTANVQFDMIGFDTCLMATVENGLMLSNYADYLVASEEVEPSTGWYYTDWLSALGSNTSMPTLEIGKNICDSFISSSNSSAWGLGCTLSVVDLAELRYTVPERLAAFSNDISDMLDSGNSSNSYKTVVNARTASKEFGETESLDQIDLVNFANNLGTSSAAELSDALKSAIKYNAVSRGMSNAYGISAFFPYKRAHFADTAAAINEEIGVSSEYSRAIKKFASVEGAGQSIFGGSSDGYGSLFDALYGGGSSYSDNTYSSGDISDLLTGLLGGRDLDPDTVTDFLVNNQFDASKLVWTTNADGKNAISLSEDQWSLVKDVTLNTFYFDGEGYYDLGADNYFELDSDGNLVGEYNGTWLSIEGQLVAYYFDSMTYGEDDFSIRGRVPVLYNGERAQLVIIFDSSNPQGYIAGLTYDYDPIYEQGDMTSKTLAKLEEGAEISFLADYYDAEGSYENTYEIGDVWSYKDGAEIANITVEGGDVLALYQFKDIYNNTYWTPRIP